MRTLLLFLLCCLPLRGATITAASNSRNDVNTAVGTAVDGDTVVVPTTPSATVTWTSGITVSGKGVHIRPSSRLAVTITHDAGSSALFAVTKDATHHTIVNGFRFLDGTGNTFIGVSGSSSAKPVLICSNFFKSEGSLHIVDLSASSGGVMWENAIYSTSGHLGGCIQLEFGTTEGLVQWALPATFGTDDTDGTSNFYFEDNYCTNIQQQTIDGDNGSRPVARRNTMYDSAFVIHGPDTSQGGGARQFEFYDNTFIRVNNGFPINRWFYIRGATGVIKDNVIPEASSPDGSSYPNKTEIDLTMQNLRRDDGSWACWGASEVGVQYPGPRQVGQDVDSEDATPNRPVIIHGNTGAGTGSGNFIAVTDFDSNECGGGADTADDYIIAGRDYTNSVAWSYTKFTYPHPLRAQVDGGGGSPANTVAARVGPGRSKSR